MQKFAVINDTAVITSANLTEDALTRNIEVGVVIERGEIPTLIRIQFSELIETGILRSWLGKENSCV